MTKPADLKSPFSTANPDNWPSYIEDFRRAGHETVEWIANYLATVRDMPVLATTQPGELFDALPHSAPNEGESFEAVLRDFDRLVMPAVTQWNHPRFFAYFACTGSTPAILGEMLAAALNTNGLHWKTSPAVAELEQRTLDWLRQWLGLPEKPEPWFGIVYDTASTSSMHAVVCAREMVAPEARTEGSRGDLTLYTSDQSHMSIEKGAIAVGVGQNNIRKVPSDSNFRMDARALAAMIEQDKAAGKRPFCVVATVGTTSSTSVDPVADIADIAEQNGMWLHVDAAYAGAAAILPEHKDILAGIERAHSLVFNAHKWLLTPIDLSAFFTRRPDILRRAFSLTPDYLKTQADPRAHNLMDYGVPLGHRFRALKLWFVLRYFGRDRIEAMLRRHIQWARDFAALITNDPEHRFEVVAPVPFSVVCFRYRGKQTADRHQGDSSTQRTRPSAAQRSDAEIDEQNRAIMERVNASGRVFISGTVLNNLQVIRLAIGNLGTTWQDVEETWELLKKAADEL
ncbi:MAG: pyridoxal phosphate-dependent decarboxylase family protein [Actinomycetota bacterium]